MNISLGQTYSFHQVGKRNNQEDSRFPDNDMPSKDQRFFVVCDGVGGSNCGEVASLTVCESIAKSLEDFDFAQDFTNESFGEMLGIAYNALDKVTDGENEDMATTFTFAAFHGGGVTLAHIGDSRIYQIRPSIGIIYHSDDHSLVNQMIHSGLLSPEDALSHPHKNVITRYMGPTSDKQSRCSATVMRTIDVENGDFFLLCTDGVTNKMQDEELVAIISDSSLPQEKIAKMSSICKDSSDNNTAILIPVTSVKCNKSLESADRVDACEKTLRNSERQQMVEEVEPVSQERRQGVFSSLIKKILNSVTVLYSICMNVHRYLFMVLLTIFVFHFCRAQSLIERAKKGNESAIFMIASDYARDGHYKKAVKWAEKSEDVWCKCLLAALYFEGRGVKKDTGKAMELFMETVNRKHAYGAAAIAYIYKTYLNNDEMAVEWLYRSKLLETAYVDTINLGLSYRGLHTVLGFMLVQKNDAEFSTTPGTLLINYADNSNRIACRYVGELTLRGYMWDNYKGRFKKAMNYYEKAAQHGDEESKHVVGKKGYAEIGKMYYDGVEVPYNPELAVEFFEQGKLNIEDTLSENDILDSQFYNGLAYYEGKGHPQSYEEAFYRFSIAAKYDGYNGDYEKIIADEKYTKEYHCTEAMRYLSRCYRFGRGCEKNLTEADKWIKIAAVTDEKMRQFAEQMKMSNVNQ